MNLRYVLLHSMLVKDWQYQISKLQSRRDEVEFLMQMAIQFYFFFRLNLLKVIEIKRVKNVGESIYFYVTITHKWRLCAHSNALHTHPPKSRERLTLNYIFFDCCDSNSINGQKRDSDSWIRVMIPSIWARKYRHNHYIIEIPFWSRSALALEWLFQKYFI